MSVGYVVGASAAQRVRKVERLRCGAGDDTVNHRHGSGCLLLAAIAACRAGRVEAMQRRTPTPSAPGLVRRCIGLARRGRRRSDTLGGVVRNALAVHGERFDGLAGVVAHHGQRLTCATNGRRASVGALALDGGPLHFGASRMWLQSARPGLRRLRKSQRSVNDGRPATGSPCGDFLGGHRS